MNLFKISQELINFFNSPAETQNQNDLKTFIENRTDEVALYREQLLKNIELLENHQNEVDERINLFQKQIQQIDNQVLAILHYSEKDRIDGELYKLQKRKPSQVLIIEDENKIPIDFIKIPEPKPIIMKAEIKKALQNGELIDGCRLGEGQPNLMVKLK